MAAKIPILLSSSPRQILIVTPPNSLQVPMSSSPLLPSPSQLFTKKSLVIPASDSVNSVSSDTISGFTSASILLRQAQEFETKGDALYQRLQEAAEKANFREEKPKVFKKPVIEVSEDDSTVQKADDNQETLPNSDQKTDLDGDLRAPKDPTVSQSIIKNKKRVRNKEGTQSKIKKGKIIKPGITGDLSGSKSESTKTAKPLKDSPLKVASASSKRSKRDPAGEKSLDLLLVEAVRRRKNWTPVKDTNNFSSPDIPIKKLQNIKNDSEEHAIDPVQCSGFDDLLDNFQCAQQSNDHMLNSEQMRSTNGVALVKRRKIEAS